MPWHTVSPRTFKRARELRKDMSAPERILWSLLRDGQLEVKFRRQHPIGPFIADFYARDAKLDIEIDSDTAHGTEEAEERDQRRDTFMRRQGLTVLRIPANEIFYNLDGVIDTIRLALSRHVYEIA